MGIRHLNESRHTTRPIQYSRHDQHLQLQSVNKSCTNESRLNVSVQVLSKLFFHTRNNHPNTRDRRGRDNERAQKEIEKWRIENSTLSFSYTQQSVEDFISLTLLSI